MCVCESGRSTEAIPRTEIKTNLYSCRASVEHYSKPTDTASGGTSSELMEALYNSAGEKQIGKLANVWRPSDDKQAGFGS